jgi:hypothetical protein
MFYFEATKRHKEVKISRTFKNLLRADDEDSPSLPVPAEEERTVFASLRGTGKSEVL